MEGSQSSFGNNPLDQLKRHDLELSESVRYLQDPSLLLQLQRIDNLPHLLKLVLVLIVEIFLQRQQIVLKVGQP